MAGTGSMSPSSSGYNVVQTPRFSPEKMQQMQQLRGRIEPGFLKGVGNLSQLAGGDESSFEQLEAPALRQFGQLQGQLASRFSGMGSGARRSSGFQNAASGQASELAERLQGQRLGLQQQAIQQLLGLYGDVTQDPYEMMLQEKKKSKGSSWFGAALPFLGAGLGGAAGFFTGGPAGALAGAQFGGSLGSAGSKAFF
jgi:hypothetical protein